jgi:group I intron endonuclease
MVVYKVTNKINGNFYLGQTVGTAQERLLIHFRDVKQNGHLPFYRAIAKYGKENFQTKVLYKAHSQEDMDEKEAKLIAYFKITCEEKLYNIADGGQGLGFNRLINAEKTIDILTGQTFDSAKDMARYYGLSYVFTLNLLNGKALSKKGYVFRYEDKEKSLLADARAEKLPKHKSLPKKIVCLETGKVFTSTKIAAQEMGISRTAINNNLKGRSKTAGKLSFKYSSDQSLSRGEI